MQKGRELIALCSMLVHGAEMVEVHCTLAKIQSFTLIFELQLIPDVPSCTDGRDEENKNKRDWVEEYVSFVEDWQR